MFFFIMVTAVTHDGSKIGRYPSIMDMKPRSLDASYSFFIMAIM